MFDTLAQVPADPILQINARAKQDKHDRMANLSIGEYKNEKWQAYVPDIVQETIKSLPTNNFWYTQAAGLPEYLDATGKLLLQNFDKNTIAMQATTGGTWSLSLIQQLIYKAQSRRTDGVVVYRGDPTRGNHNAIFSNTGQRFNHLTKDREINEAGYVDTMYNNPGSHLLLQAWLTHNPTGINFTYTQLKKIIDVARDKGIKIILDVPYFGLGQTFQEDREWIWLVWENVDDVAMNISYSKNASLYNMRTGALFIKTTNKEAVESHLQQLCRATVSTAPATGQQIMADIIHTPQKYKKREKEVGGMKDSLQKRRTSLVEALNDPQFAYIANGAGLFAMLPLTSDQAEELTKYHIYILPNGRINIAGIHENNVEYIANSIKAVL